MSMFFALVAFCLCGSAFAQIPGLGRCPRLNAQANFSTEKFLGRWYEATRHPHLFELNTKCNVIDYDRYPNGTVRCTNSYISGFTGKAGAVHVPVHVPRPDEAAKMKVRMPLAPEGAISNYWVLGTDYESYVVIYSCTQYKFFNMKYGWILTRKRNPTDDVLQQAWDVIDRNNLKRSNFWAVEQDRCWVKPEQDE